MNWGVGVKSWEVVFLPFDKIKALMMSETVANPMLPLAHATS